MKKRLLIVPAFLVLIFLLQARGVFVSPLVEAASTTYYVATTGSDSNPGTATQPWQTIQKAANTMVAGDSVIVNAGTYPEAVSATTAGAGSTQMISYIANGTVNITSFSISGNYVKVQGFSVMPTFCGSWEGAIDVRGSYDQVLNNIIHDSTQEGIVAEPGSSYSTIRGNTIRTASIDGIAVFGDNHLIENNDIADVVDHLGTCTWWHDANGVEFHGSGNVFRGNYIHDFFKSHQNSNPHADAFQTFSDPANGAPAAKNTLVERNHIFMGNNGKLEEAWDSNATISGFMIQGAAGDVADNLAIENNIVESWKGLDAGGSSGYVTNLKIYNNTWKSSLAFTSAYWPSAFSMYGVSFEAYDNITTDFSYAHYDLTASTGKYSNNLLWNSNGTMPYVQGYAPQATDKIEVNPMFVSATDYHLQTGSPAIDAGTAIAGDTISYDGTTRPQGAAYDMGAYEYAGSVPPTNTPTRTSTPLAPTNTPTRTNTPLPTIAPPTSTPTAAPPTATPTMMLPTNTPTIAATPVIAQPTPGGTTITLAPVADTFVNSKNPGRNFGSNIMLEVESSPLVNSYLRFNVQGVNTGVAKAVLKIYADSALSSGFVVNAVSANNWGETTMSYNDAPAIGSPIASSGPVASNTWITVDVTSYITGNGTFSIALTGSSSSILVLASRESTQPPALVITTR